LPRESTLKGPLLAGHKRGTLTSDYGTDSAPCISISEGTGLYPITIRNGTITMFEEGVLANSASNITVKNVVLEQNALGVYFISVDSSTIQNCTFHLNSYGIEDRQSTGGNSYNNNTFGLGGGLALYVQSQFQSTLVLDRCDFDAPPAP
jgi:parallel beta-helix repeat protein